MTMLQSRVYSTAAGSLHMTPSTPTQAALASTPRPIPTQHPPANPSSLYPTNLIPLQQRPLQPPKVNLAEEEDAADYRPGGYHPVHIMDTFSENRYLVLRKMGWGHFSTVWLAKDNQSNRHVALKIMKSSRRYTETALDEIKLLQSVRAANPKHRGYDYVVSFLDSFQHMGVHDQYHVCMTFEPLGENLLSLTQRCVKENKLAAATLARQRRANPHLSHAIPTTSPPFDLAVPIAIVKIIAKQILLGIDYLHSECKLIHTDLKPENVLVALEDVEEVVRMELELVPTSESMKASALTHINFPPSHMPRPNSPSSLHHSHSPANQVYIFSSQPLSSPSRTPVGSLSNSPMERLAMRMTQMGLNTKPVPAEEKDKDKKEQEKEKEKGKPSPPPAPMEVGMGIPTVAKTEATANGTVIVGTPGSGGAAELMASAGHGKPIPGKSSGASKEKEDAVNLSDVDGEGMGAGVGSLSSSLTGSFDEQPVTPTDDDGGVLVAGVEGVKGMLAPPIRIVRTDDEEIGGGSVRELSICDDRTETGTVVGDTRDTTPTPGQQPSLLSQTAPKTPTTPATAAPPPPVDTPAPAPPPPAPTRPMIRVKIADLGNATPISHHFTNDIQTRQYRSPEAILGLENWDERVDVWSIACVVFELLTGEYLFNPKSRPGCWGKDDDHVAQVVELMGDGFTKEMKVMGKWSREIWRSNGSLRNISKLHNWPLASVMADKYDYKPEVAALFASFMEPMLAVDWNSRARAKDMLDHPWLDS